MKLSEAYCTICSRDKRTDHGSLPARLRYLSRRIDWCLQESRRNEKALLILSGKFGLIDADAAISYYDRLLVSGDLPDFVPKVVEQLRARALARLVFLARPRHTQGWEAYYEALEQACAIAGVGLELRVLDFDSET